MRRIRPSMFAAWAPALIVVTACTGEILPPEPSTGDGAPGTKPSGGSDDDGSDHERPPPGASAHAFRCDGTPELALEPLRRLSKQELLNTLGDLAGAFVPSAASALRDELRTAGRLLPDDVVSDAQDYVRMSQAVGQAHVDAWFGLARAFAAGATATPQRLAELMGPCATNASPEDDAACVTDFVRRFGRRAFRRPLAASEVTFFAQDIYAATGIDAAGLVDVVTALLSAPPFLYVLEVGAGPAPGARAGTYALSAHELASRLSFHFWRSAPDEELLGLADSGQLLEPELYAAQVSRMFRDPRTRATVDAFFAQWLELEEVPEMDRNLAREDFRAFAGSDVPTAELRAHIIEDALDLVRYMVWDTEGRLPDLFTTSLSFAKTADVLALYGDAPRWQPGQAPRPFPDGSRAGLLTRLAMLVNNQATTRPIIKGARIRKRVLCDELQLPQNMEQIMLSAPDGVRSTRQQIEDLTEQPGSACMNCHRVMNPLGFATEGFDALGRRRTVERVYDERGRQVSALPIDTAGVVPLDGEDVPIEDALELSELVGNSAQVEACFARHYFRFTFGRREDVRRDGCVLESLRSRVEDGAPLARVLEEIALEPAFKWVKK
jgi:hypothetical protein